MEPAPDRPQPYSWRRVRVMLGGALAVAVVNFPAWPEAYALLPLRLIFVGAVQLGVFALLERRPRRLPGWLARWALQVAGVGLVVPFAMAIAYALTTFDTDGAWFHDPAVMAGYSRLTMLGLLISPWIAVAALLRQIRNDAHNQALAFELERSQLARQALDARLRVLQAQVEPHFLFNTLANVRELVDSGSAQAVVVLDNLITYLRAAVTRLHSEANTLAEEFQLVHAYLELMQMRMADRLQYSVTLDQSLRSTPCPPMALLTLVENAVRHGIDPSAEGGSIDVRASRCESTCRVDVADTGVGVGAATDGLGTGLSTLRERLALAYGGRARLTIEPRSPHGTLAIVEWPLEVST
jgi:two-component sensor histidine kinase